MARSYSGFRQQARDLSPSLRATGAASLSIATAPAFVTSSGFSFACWVKTFDFSSTQSLLTNSTTVGAPQFRISASCQLEILPRTGAASLLSAAVIVRGEWHHVAVTYGAAAGRTTVYCDGEAVAMQIGTIGGMPFAQPSGAVTTAYNSGTLVGRLGFWGRELTQAEVRAECYRSAGPTEVALYPLTEGTGATTADILGGASATINAMSWSDDAPVYPARQPQDWGSIYQSGAGYLTLPSTSSDNLGLALAGKGSFQASVWVKLTAAQASIDLLRVNTSSVVGLRLQLDGGTNLIATVRAGLDGSAAALSKNVTVPLAVGRWVHYSIQATISDGASGRIKLYRNGLLIANTAADFSGQTAIAWATSGAGTTGVLGGGTSGANPVPGWVGPVRIEGALTQAQLRSLVYSGKSGLGDPWAEWRFAAGVGASAVNTGSSAGLAATLNGTAAWSLEAPW